MPEKTEMGFGDRLFLLDDEVRARLEEIETSKNQRVLFAYSDFAPKITALMDQATESVEGVNPVKLANLENEWSRIKQMLDEGPAEDELPD